MLIRVIAATALVVAAASALIVSGRPETAPPLTPGSFYLRLTLYIDGQVRGDQLWARNAEGWIAHAQASPGRRPISRELLDGNGSVVLINDQIGARSTFDRVERGLDPFGTPSSGCTLTAEGRQLSGRRIGETRLNGLRAIIFQKMNGARERWTDWVIPELNCVVLRSVTESQSGANEPWRIVRHLTSSELEVGAYPAWIFALPREYREMGPMAVLHELGDDTPSARMEAVENSYRTNAARRRDPAYAGSPAPEPPAVR